MPAWPAAEISDAEIELIRAYVESLGPGEEDEE